MKDMGIKSEKCGDNSTCILKLQSACLGAYRTAKENHRFYNNKFEMKRK